MELYTCDNYFTTYVTVITMLAILGWNSHGKWLHNIDHLSSSPAQVSITYHGRTVQYICKDNINLHADI